MTLRNSESSMLAANPRIYKTLHTAQVTVQLEPSLSGILRGADRITISVLFSVCYTEIQFILVALVLSFIVYI